MPDDMLYVGTTEENYSEGITVSEEVYAMEHGLSTFSDYKEV